jgi:hypothetical protein
MFANNFVNIADGKPGRMPAERKAALWFDDCHLGRRVPHDLNQRGRRACGTQPFCGFVRRGNRRAEPEAYMIRGERF